MSDTARTPRPHKLPTPARVGRSLYGEAFEARNAEDLSDAIADWAALDNAERSFAIAHLLYLSLQSQGRTAHHLAKVRQHLAELAEELGEVLEDLGGPSGGDGGGDDDPSDVPEAEALTSAANGEAAQG